MIAHDYTHAADWIQLLYNANIAMLHLQPTKKGFHTKKIFKALNIERAKDDGIFRLLLGNLLVKEL